MYRWFVSDVTVLLEASLTILLLSWDIVGNVCVVTLLREPEMTMYHYYPPQNRVRREH